MEPITRKEMYYAYLNGDTSVKIPEPITREEMYLYDLCVNGVAGGGGTPSDIFVVQSTGTSTTAVMSQKAVTDYLNSLVTAITNLGTTLQTKIDEKQPTGDYALKSDVPNVVQETGTSATDVMSQKTVTAALGALDERISEAIPEDGNEVAY